MVLTLLWLTISTPFVFEARQNLGRTHSSAASCPVPDENTNPFSGLNEEKSSEISISEYLHDAADLVAAHGIEITYTDTHGAGIYIAFYGELISPPPEIHRF
ncbi:MAG TPA: hypothetical protein PKV73_06120 [Agriterribacter sp.]|nr:hypothetical protein [Agriterribacter sp.]